MCLIISVSSLKRLKIETEAAEILIKISRFVIIRQLNYQKPDELCEASSGENSSVWCFWLLFQMLVYSSRILQHLRLFIQGIWNLCLHQSRVQRCDTVAANPSSPTGDTLHINLQCCLVLLIIKERERESSSHVLMEWQISAKNHRSLFLIFEACGKI